MPSRTKPYLNHESKKRRIIVSNVKDISTRRKKIPYLLVPTETSIISENLLLRKVNIGSVLVSDYLYQCPVKVVV